MVSLIRYEFPYKQWSSHQQILINVKKYRQQILIKNLSCQYCFCQIEVNVLWFTEIYLILHWKLNARKLPASQELTIEQDITFLLMILFRIDSSWYKKSKFNFNFNLFCLHYKIKKWINLILFVNIYLIRKGDKKDG